MGGTPDWSHQVLLAANPLSAGMARDFVCQHLAAHHEVGLVDDVRLVVSELATNAVAHARTPFVVTVSMTGALVLVVIEDASSSVPVRGLPDPTDMTGRGLMIVELLSRDWGMHTDAVGSKSVWASFASRSSQREPRVVGLTAP
jgi:anti-sigma regulatory factor (Ser/Thr protein kinase)